MTKRNNITFDQVIRAIVAIAVVAVIVWLIGYLKNVLLPFCVACLIAYVLEPVVEWQQKHLKLKSHVFPVFLTLLEAIILVVGLACIVIPLAINEVEQLESLIKTSSGDSTSLLFPEFQDYLKNLNLDNLREYIDPQQLAGLFSKGTSMLSSTINVVMHTIEWLLTFIYVIFIMLDYRQIMNGFRKAIPPKYRAKVYPILDDIKVNMNTYFRSQAVIAGCAAVFYCIGFSLVGLPLAIVMGLLTGILYMIPYVQYVTLIPVAILCYLDAMTGATGFWTELGKCVIVYVVSQSVCDYILTPKIMGKSLGLNPAIILLSLSVWGTLLGIIGMIIALPMTALLIAYYKQYILTENSIIETDESSTTKNR